MSEPSRPGQLRKRQLDDLRRYLADEVHPYVPLHRRALDEAGIDHGRIAGLDEFARLPLTTLEVVGTGAEHLMQPTEATIRSSGPPSLRARAQLARLTGGRARFDHEVVGPRYKPLVWTRDGRLRTGWSARDLWRLGDLGRRLLERAGVRSDDRLVTLGLEPDQLAFWQLSLGARAGGVASLHTRTIDPEVVVDGSASVVVGSEAAIDDLLGASTDHAVRTAVVIGAPCGVARRTELAERWGAEVVHAFAPPGVRSLWSEQRGVPGLVTAVDADIIEVVDGEVVWSSLGWAGTVLLRLRTGLQATVESLPSGTGGVAVTLREAAPVAS